MRETSRLLCCPSVSSRNVRHIIPFFAPFPPFFCLPRYYSSPLTSHVQSCATRAYRNVMTQQTFGALCQASLRATQRQILDIAARMQFFRDVTQCFDGSLCLHLQGSSILRRNLPQNTGSHCSRHRCESLIPRVVQTEFVSVRPSQSGQHSLTSFSCRNRRPESALQLAVASFSIALQTRHQL